MVNGARTTLALLDLIDRLQYDVMALGDKVKDLEERLELSQRVRQEQFEQINQLCADDADGGARQDMMGEFSA